MEEMETVVTMKIAEMIIVEEEITHVILRIQMCVYHLLHQT
jgi:hypothetical protein